jgi:hypothetical protein
MENNKRETPEEFICDNKKAILKGIKNKLNYEKSEWFNDTNIKVSTIRFSEQEKYWKSLSPTFKDMLIAYKKSGFMAFTQAVAEFLSKPRNEKMAMREARKLLRNINEVKRGTLREKKLNKIMQIVIANETATNEDYKNIILPKLDIYFNLNKIILDAPITPKEDITLFRGMANYRYTKEFYDMNNGDIYRIKNISSTTTNEEQAFTYISPAFLRPTDDYAPVILEFRLPANYPRYDLMYIEGCVARNPEDEYLLPFAVKTTDSDKSYIFQNYNNTTYYKQAEWKCIEIKKIPLPDEYSESYGEELKKRWGKSTNRKPDNIDLESITIRKIIFEPHKWEGQNGGKRKTRRAHKRNGTRKN